MGTNHKEVIIKNLNSLLKTMNTLKKNKDAENLIELIKAKKGWTTIAEFRFATALVKSINARAKTLNDDLKELFAGGGLVK